MLMTLYYCVHQQLSLWVAVFGALTLLLEAGWWDSLTAGVWHVLAPCATCCGLLRQAQPPEDDWAEDEDVERERYRIQDGEPSSRGYNSLATNRLAADSAQAVASLVRQAQQRGQDRPQKQRRPVANLPACPRSQPPCFAQTGSPFI